MIIESVHIKKFRGFEDVRFKLGSNITAIAGQNGTQKTTILGILAQPFTISDEENPLKKEKPLCGGVYRSAFAEKFKLSRTFDTPKNHEWTLFLNRESDSEFIIESIPRYDPTGSIRFWRKSDKSKGSGYIQMPVIYLSLSRLIPIGESLDIDISTEIALTEEENKFFKKWHDKILIIPDNAETKFEYLKSKNKNTLGVNTSYYDWKMNSAGQDNIGKILLAILSFKRLKEKYPDYYQSGILTIDELDATLYPASQIKLLEALRYFSSHYKIQIIFTTHSLTILEALCKIQDKAALIEQNKIIYLQKVDNLIKVIENISFEAIKNKLNVSLNNNPKIRKKITAFTEDEEAKIFIKKLLKSRATSLKFIDCTLGCGNYLELRRKEVPCFQFREAIIFLDGDVRKETKKLREIRKYNNLLILPCEESPERLIADFLFKLSDSSDIWDRIHTDYTKQLAFIDYSYDEIFAPQSRQKAKEWFKSQMPFWGRGCSNVINLWIEQNRQAVNQFIEEFDNLCSSYF